MDILSWMTSQQFYDCHRSPGVWFSPRPGCLPRTDRRGCTSMVGNAWRLGPFAAYSKFPCIFDHLGSIWVEIEEPFGIHSNTPSFLIFRSELVVSREYEYVALRVCLFFSVFFLFFSERGTIIRENESTQQISDLRRVRDKANQTLSKLASNFPVRWNPPWRKVQISNKYVQWWSP